MKLFNVKIVLSSGTIKFHSSCKVKAETEYDAITFAKWSSVEAFNDWFEVSYIPDAFKIEKSECHEVRMNVFGLEWDIVK